VTFSHVLPRWLILKLEASVPSTKLFSFSDFVGDKNNKKSGCGGALHL
jgi:hypothetical protein